MTFPRFDSVSSRREFFRDCARYGALGVVAAAGIGVAARSRRAARGAETCARPDAGCRACARLDGCELPLAISARQTLRPGRTVHHE
jgi:hypothetical protein